MSHRGLELPIERSRITAFALTACSRCSEVIQVRLRYGFDTPGVYVVSCYCGHAEEKRYDPPEGDKNDRHWFAGT